jgi:AraC-like DNA-binding protein/mannose-6-phosphate isomerase-like protein (cupin superfamily)
MKENLHENRRRGNVLFPFEHYDMFTNTGSIFVPYHWHEEVEIILVTRGKVELMVDGKKLILTPGDIVFVNSGQLHQYTSLEEITAYNAYVFPPASLKFDHEDITQTTIISPICNGKLCFPMQLFKEHEAYPKVRSLIEQIIDVNNRQASGFPLLTKAYLYEIIALLYENRLLTRQVTVQKDADTCRQILSYIQEHYQEKIVVPDIAKCMCMSPNYFSAYFTGHFGRNFIDFLIHYRIEQACILLLSENLSVTQAALQTGFENVSYFIKKFKAVTGMTPAAYRKSMQSKT